MPLFALGSCSPRESLPEFARPATSFLCWCVTTQVPQSPWLIERRAGPTSSPAILRAQAHVGRPAGGPTATPYASLRTDAPAGASYFRVSRSSLRCSGPQGQQITRPRRPPPPSALPWPNSVLRQDLLDAASGATLRALRSSASHTGRRLACPQGLALSRWHACRRQRTTLGQPWKLGYLSSYAPAKKGSRRPGEYQRALSKWQRTERE